jgi:type VI secretion system protein ImpM
VNAMSDSPMLYFGKLPSRGDFVRSNNHRQALIQVLDRWLSSGMELMSADPRWKELYDRAAPAQFALLGSRHPQGLVGHLIASQDASGRRFPFVVAATFDATDPLAFFSRAPLALARPWSRLDRLARQAQSAADAAPVLGEFADTAVGVETNPSAYEAPFADFCEMHTIGALQSMLTGAGHALQLRQTILGLGMLLQPVLASGESRLESGLALPLPADPMLRPSVASLWLDLIGGFLERAAFELALFMPRGEGGNVGGAPMLLLGFEGNSPRSLHGLLDGAQAQQLYVTMSSAEWVEPAVAQDYALHKLSSYLMQDGLSLAQALRTFKEVFLGR